jgi:TPR repeat protein
LITRERCGRANFRYTAQDNYKECQMGVLGQKARLAAALSMIVACSQAPAQEQAAPKALTPVVAGSTAPGDNLVVVTGNRASGRADEVTAAKSKVLSRKYASSCAFMSSPNAAEDDVARAYMEDFGMWDSISNPVDRFSDRAPDGDASNAKDSSSLEDFNGPEPDDTTQAAVKCGASDRRFAAGRNAILRKDKSLAQGFEALDQRDYPRAMTLLTTAWNKIGYDEAGLALAKMHLFGMGTPKNSKEAIRWLRQVAEARFDPTSDRLRFDPRHPEQMSEKVEAAFMLARIYERGIGVPKDALEAKKWYAKADDFGFVPARNVLGEAWLNGYGGQRDARKAFDYLQSAAQEGYVTAQYNLAKLCYTGDTGVPRDLKLAGAWFNAAAKAGHPGALFAAGRMYDLGEGVPADPKRAIVYYKEAAVKGDPDAEFALGTFFYEGELVTKNLATARRLFDAAAKQGQVDAMFNLGAMEINGEGGPADLAMAYVWLNLAKSGGHASADAALKTVAPRLSAQERARADAILKPAAKS